MSAHHRPRARPTMKPAASSTETTTHSLSALSVPQLSHSEPLVWPQSRYSEGPADAAQLVEHFTRNEETAPATELFPRSRPFRRWSAMVTDGHVQHPRASSVCHCERARVEAPYALRRAVRPWTANARTRNRALHYELWGSLVRGRQAWMKAGLRPNQVGSAGHRRAGEPAHKPARFTRQPCRLSLPAPWPTRNTRS
jgi:hypothetical protein